MSTEEENREFQLTMLKLQIIHQEISSSIRLLITVEFAAFTSLGVTYLSFGLTSGNMLYIITAVFSFVILYIASKVTIHYFQKEKTYRKFDENLEKEIQCIRDRFMHHREKEKSHET